MKLEILQENLAQGLLKVIKFIDTRGQLSILSNILLEAQTGKLKLSSTNLETGINLWLPAKIEKPGKITIPAKVLTEFVSSLPADKVLLDLEQSKLNISCRNYKASFNGIAAAEFPSVPSLKKEMKKKPETIKLKADKFLKAVDQVAFTAAQDESRPVLTGVKLEFKPGKIILAATDGYRLSYKTLKTKNRFKAEYLIIPAKALIELRRICGQEESEQVSLSLVDEGNQAIFTVGDVEIVTRLIEGEFPDFTKIIPEDKETSVVLDREEFKSAIKTASIFAKDSANIIKFDIKKNKLSVSANAPEVGENEIKLDCKVDGSNNTIAFNFRFLQEYLNCVDSQEILIDILGPLKPGVFKPAGNSTFLYIIMPVRVQE
jgi:DNA polymerase III subunit beta